MEQRELFCIDYQLNRKELWEMSLWMTWDSIVQYRPLIILGITWMIGAIFIAFMKMTMGGGGMSLLFHVLPILIVFVCILLLTHVLNYRNLVKSGLLNSCRLSLESGYVKLEKSEVFVSPVSSYTKIIKGRTVLLLGQKLSNKTTSFVGVPRRVFVSDRELESFVTVLRHNTVQEESAFNEKEGNEKWDFVLTFKVTQEQWARIYGGMVQILINTPSGRRRKWGIAAGVSVLAAAVMMVTMYVKGYNLMQMVISLIILMLAIGMLITLAFFQKPHVGYQKWMEKGLMPMESIGEWEIGVCGDGCYTLHNGSYMRLHWSDYHCSYEAEDTLYFFDQNLKHFMFIPKESLGGEDGQERFFAYFRRRGMEFAEEKGML